MKQMVISRVSRKACLVRIFRVLCFFLSDVPKISV